MTCVHAPAHCAPMPPLLLRCRSKLLLDDGSAKTSTIASTNPKWLAPEVVTGRPATHSADVFSFGVVSTFLGKTRLQFV